MKTTLLLLTLFLSSLVNAWTIDKVGQYQFESIAKNVFVIHGPVGTPSVNNKGFMNNPAMIIGWAIKPSLNAIQRSKSTPTRKCSNRLMKAKLTFG